MEIKPLNRGGTKFTIPDDESDSLVIIEVTRRNGVLTVKTGLRGNFDVARRPMRYSYATLDAPDVDPSERLERKRRALAELASVVEETYVDVLFPGQQKSWTYRLPKNLGDETWVGRYVSVKDGVFKRQVGRVTAIHHRHPNAPYLYDVSAVIAV